MREIWRWRFCPTVTLVVKEPLHAALTDHWQERMARIGFKSKGGKPKYGMSLAEEVTLTTTSV